MKKATFNKYSKGEMHLHQTADGRIKLEIQLKDETIWLSQPLMAELFHTTQENINQHIQEIYQEGELSQKTTHKKFLSVHREGNLEVRRKLDFYNLDMIICVGYRVKSSLASRLRIWATQQLKEYITKGFILDDERLKNSVNQNYFDELLERINDIRASEQRLYLRIREIFAMATDYEPDCENTTIFFNIMQNKLYFAATGMTVAELVYHRANHLLPNMGLTVWKGDEVRKADVTTAKNYLQQDEITLLNKIATMWLDFSEEQVQRHQQIFMKDWEQKLNDFLRSNKYRVEPNAETINNQLAVQHAKAEYDKFEICRRAFKESLGEAEAFKQLEQIAKVLEKIKTKNIKKIIKSMNWLQGETDVKVLLAEQDSFRDVLLNIGSKRDRSHLK